MYISSLKAVKNSRSVYFIVEGGEEFAKRTIHRLEERGAELMIEQLTRLGTKTAVKQAAIVLLMILTVLLGRIT